jgi:hypothetical protein
MTHVLVRAAALAFALLAAPLTAFAAATPTPAPHPIVLPSPHLPNKPLHVQLQVEVNKHGQVVRVLHGDLSGDRPFDLMALGNAMQMWIRHPNGSAQVGLYRVVYDYDPRTHNVNRVPSLIKAGGTWGDKPGAATLIMKQAQLQAQAIEKRLRAEQEAKEKEKAKNLPDINAAVKRAMASPTPHP